MAYHFPSLLSQTPPHQCQRPHSSRILFFAIHKGGPCNCHTSGSRSRMLYVQTRHKISLSQCSRPPLRLGTSGYEMGRALFFWYGPLLWSQSAPFLFDEFSSAVEWIIQTKLNIPKVIHILDDFFFATSPPRSKCMTALCQILHLFTDLNIPIAPGKTFPACTCLEFMGILLDSNTMEARLPVDKLTRIQEALGQWTTRKSATLQELQSLIGTLQFAC